MNQIIEKQKFLDLIKNNGNSEEDLLTIVRKYLLHGTPFIFKGNDDSYFEFRSQIANQWKISFHNVLVLGSGKLGYSYHKENVFNLESDIDVAIVDVNLYEQFFLYVREFQYQIDNSTISLTQDDYKKYHKFLKYMIKGWMRPDLLPSISGLQNKKNEWFNFFKSVSYNNCKAGYYKVSAGLFKDFSYMERYYLDSVKKLIV